METGQASPMFDTRIATALVAGPVLAIVIHSYAQPLLLPAAIAGMIAQSALMAARPISRLRIACIAGLFGFSLLGFGLLI